MNENISKNTFKVQTKGRSGQSKWQTIAKVGDAGHADYVAANLRRENPSLSVRVVN